MCVLHITQIAEQQLVKVSWILERKKEKKAQSEKIEMEQESHKRLNVIEQHFRQTIHRQCIFIQISISLSQIYNGK